MFVPEASDEDRALRARIHLARDTANSRRERSTNFETGRLYAQASAIAGQWVFKRGIDKAALEEVIKVLSWLFLAAGALERLEHGDE